jgi:hypothetical protein
MNSLRTSNVVVGKKRPDEFCGDVSKYMKYKDNSGAAWVVMPISSRPGEKYLRRLND